MLVRVQHETALSGAERRLVEWLRSWVGEYVMPGIAVVNCNVPGPGGVARQVDAVIWTPSGCAVIEAKGFMCRQDGTLRIPLNGEWTVDGAPAALHTTSEANPAEQLKTNLYAVKNSLTAKGVDPGFVSGMVVVLPARGAKLKLDRAVAAPGVDGGQSPLRRYFHQLGRRRVVWGVDEVAAVFTALDLIDFLPNRDDLLSHGFAAQVPAAPSARPAAAPATPVVHQPRPALTPRLPPRWSKTPAAPDRGRVRAGAALSWSAPFPKSARRR